MTRYFYCNGIRFKSLAEAKKEANESGEPVYGVVVKAGVGRDGK